MSFDDLLKTLQADYLKSLPAKIKIIQDQIAAGDAPNVRESFHKLKGTGKTYGFPEVSEMAAVVEGICIREPKKGLEAATHALALLQDIYSVRQTAPSFALEQDQRMLVIRKLLPG